MTKLIDAELIIEELEKIIQLVKDADGVKVVPLVENALDITSEYLKTGKVAPKFDFANVVRCKECRHGEKMKSKLAGRITAVFCHKNKKERFMLENDYCSYGERGRR